MSVFEKNMWEIHDMAQKVRDLGAKAFSYNWVDDFGRGRDIIHPTKDAEQHRKFMEYEQNMIDEFKDLIPIIPYERKRAANCGAGWKSIVISRSAKYVLAPSFQRNFHWKIFFMIPMKASLTPLSSINCGKRRRRGSANIA